MFIKDISIELSIQIQGGVEIIDIDGHNTTPPVVVVESQHPLLIFQLIIQEMDNIS